MPDIRIHKDIIISGRVQGVGFRFACRNAALSMGIKGFVKNMYNGKVYIEAEGTEQQVIHFIEWCKKGPGYAHVSDIEITDGKLKEFRHFDVLH